MTTTAVTELIVPQVNGHEASMKVRELLQRLREDGWYLAAVRGSHHQFKHPSKPGRVTVPGRPGDDLAVGTLKSILRQAGLANHSLE